MSNPGIGNFLIPDPGIEKTVPGLQTLTGSFILLHFIVRVDENITYFGTVGPNRSVNPSHLLRFRNTLLRS